MSGLQSMTGFGRGAHTGAAYRVQVEIRSVNHRFREIVIRGSRDLPGLEEAIRARVAERVARGRVDVHVTVEPLPGARRLHVDTDLALSYHRALETLRDNLGLETPITLELIAGFPGILALEDPSEDAATCWADVEPALEQALDGLMAMRRAEGAALAAELREAAARVAQRVEAVAERAPQVVEEYRRRLAQRVEALAGDLPIDPDRLAAEVVLFAERADIREELVRLRSHLGQFQDALQADEPVGRKLDFLLQEMVREINTIAAKAHDAVISAAVVEMKTEVERMREQAQNVE